MSSRILDGEMSFCHKEVIILAAQTSGYGLKSTRMGEEARRLGFAKHRCHLRHPLILTPITVRLGTNFCFLFFNAGSYPAWMWLNSSQGNPQIDLMPITLSR